MDSPSSIRNEALEEEIKRIIALSDTRGDFVTGDDGFVVFWPENCPRGAFAAWHLRALADELDRRNADWEKQIGDYFSSLKTSPQPVGEE